MFGWKFYDPYWKSYKMQILENFDWKLSFSENRVA